MNIQELQTERLDINNKYNVELICKQLDDIILKIIIYDKNLPADLSNYNVRLKAFKADQVPIIQNTNITIKDNVVTIKADKQLTTTNGIVKAELQFINKTTLEKKSTFYLEIEVVASVLMDKNVISTPTCTLLEELDNKLEQIENIGNVLEEAKVVRDTLENTTIPTGTTLKSDLDTNIKTGTQLKIDLTELIPQVNKSKSDLDTSKRNADLSNTTLTETTNNAETKKQEIVAECKVADEKIKQMNEFGDVTEVVKDVTSLKTEVTTARDNEIDLNTRLERDKTNILNIIGNVNVETDGNVASQLKDCVNNLSQLSNPSLLINDCFQINQRGQKEYTSNGKSPYTLDRWRCFTLIGGDVKEVAKVTPLDKGVKVTAVSGGTNGKPGARLRQTLESDLTNRLKGKTLTFSIKLLEDCDCVFIHINKSTNVNIVNKSYRDCKMGDIVSLTFVVPNDASNLNVQFMSVGEPGNSISVEYAKLELGSVATPFVPRSYEEELALCQRYCSKDEFIGYGTSTKTIGVFQSFGVQKRISPTIEIKESYSGTINTVIDIDTNAKITSSNLTTTKGQGAIWEIVSTEDVFTKGNMYKFILYSDSEIY